MGNLIWKIREGFSEEVTLSLSSVEAGVKLGKRREKSI